MTGNSDAKIIGGLKSRKQDILKKTLKKSRFCSPQIILSTLRLELRNIAEYAFVTAGILLIGIDS